MPILSSGADAASRVAYRLLAQRLTGVSAVKDAFDVETSAIVDQPQLRAAQIVEGTALRAKKVPNVSRGMALGFTAFLDGSQKVRIIAQREGIPLVFGITAAAVRSRANRRLSFAIPATRCGKPRPGSMPLRSLLARPSPPRS